MSKTAVRVLILAIIVFAVCVLYFVNSKRENYISNTTSKGDRYVDLWNREMFLPVCDIKINYLVSYHNITKFPYHTDTVNIILDGEPMDLSDVNANLIITTKKERLPKAPMPQIYLPYFVWAFTEKQMDPDVLIKKPGEVVRKDKFCCFMYSNCDENMDGVRNRRRFLERMNEMTGNRVDNLGKCYSKKFKPNGSWTSNDDIYEPYKFVIAFENQRIRGYITEKLIMPMVARAIPIYLGAPDVGDYVNVKSFINVNDFPDFESCIRYVMQVDEDEGLYNSILKQPYFVSNTIDRNLFSLYYGGKFYHDLYRALEPYGLKEFIRPCKYYTNNIRFITFADGKKYKTDRILKEADESGFFKEAVAYGPKDFDELFKARHNDFIHNNPRGYGYWVWKPYVILLNLDEMNDGDFLMFSDSGNTINFEGYKRIKEYYSLLEKHSIIAFRIQYDEKMYNKMDTVTGVVKTLGNEQNVTALLEGKQVTAACLLVKKTPMTVKLMQLWYSLCSEYHLVDDSPSVQPNLPVFKEHRHDQSILSLIVKSVPECIILDDNYSDGRDDYTTLDGIQKPFVVSRKKR